MRILIVDDHAVVREGLKHILSHLPEQSDICEAQDGQEAMRMVREADWSVVLLDVGLPDKNALDVLKQIKREKPALPVLILSMFPEDQYAIRMLRAGASGYLTKESAPDQLLSAIALATKGEKYVSPAVAAQLVAGLGGRPDEALHEALSDREFQILQMIASGSTVGEIATQLNLSVKTVSSYRTRVLEKLQLKNNAQLMVYAMTHGLLS
jgi:DNA-binding NarL/FixJ family response regulator